MNALTNILCVEDVFVNAKTIYAMFKKFPGVNLTVVADAENAAKAILGEPFLEWNLQDKSFVERLPIEVFGVIWDNQFPAKLGEGAADDMGIKTATAMCTSQKVAAAVCGRFVVSSADSNQEKFKSCGIFSKLYPKPFKRENLSEILKDWGIATAGEGHDESV